jgi:predicted NBD/HSP70 family sugar kinase
MVSDKGTAAGLGTVVAAMDAISGGDVKKRKQVRGIGICSAVEIAKIFGVPVRIDNDANGAALAGVRWGAGRRYCNVFYATIGTGIGTGIVFGGQIYPGPRAKADT